MPTVVLGMKLYSCAEVSELLQVSLQSVSKYISKKQLKAQRVGGRYLISEENLKEFLSGTNAK